MTVEELMILFDVVSTEMLLSNEQKLVKMIVLENSSIIDIKKKFQDKQNKRK
jgi:hypothetical protein